MNESMQISAKQSQLSLSLADMIKQLDVSKLSIVDLGVLIQEHIKTRNPDICEICHMPYISAAYFSNGGDYEDFRGGVICEDCLVKALGMLRSDQ